MLNICGAVAPWSNAVVPSLVRFLHIPVAVALHNTSYADQGTTEERGKFYRSGKKFVGAVTKCWVFLTLFKNVIA
jgi:hypothetical protein